ncbi:C80 family cysteine peptidase [Burkholderia ubonensis]|uniref:two-partner secretion domain-containing protein n=1 Tax=Burkholderia ubonensis TaxID=101571 RepID=UPI000A5C2A49|nr:C80 family cysteine peptidase [Burkholderia ubonensis]
MNKNVFRLVLNVAIGMLVPVSEVSRGRGKGGRDSARAQRRRGVASAVLLGAAGPSLVYAAVVADPSAGAQGPGVTKTANGTDLVHIVAPNAAGLSHNKFSEFSPVGHGVVLNNSTTPGVSQIGGLAMQNPNLSQPARAALLEVTQQRSTLQGTLEAFGGKLDVLVANQHGVTINGLRTLNVGRLGVTTGQVLPQADGTVRVGVRQGDVLIERGGIDTQGLSAFDVVSRSIAVHGPISDSSGVGADVRLVAGSTTYDPQTGDYAATSPDGSAAPALGISGEALGAMYGRHIVLASTESGVGVRHDGAITSANDIRVSANGEVTLGGPARAGRDVTLAASGVGHGVSTQEVSAKQGTVKVSAPGRVALHGEAAAEQDVVLQGGSVSTAAVRAQRDVSATASGDVTLNGAVQTQRDVVVAAGGEVAVKGDVQAARNVQIGTAANRAGAVTVGAGGSVTAGGSLGIQASRDVTLNGDVQAARVTLATRGLLQQAAKLLATGGQTVTLTDPTLEIEAGGYRLTGTLSAVDGQGRPIAGARIVLSHGVMQVLDARGQRLTGAQIVSRALTQSAGAATLVTSGDWVNDQGVVNLQGASSTATVGGQLTNQGVLASAGRLAIGTPTLTNAGSIQGAQGLTIGADGSLGTLTNTGSLDGGSEALGITARELTNTDGDLRAAQAVTLNLDRLTNAGAVTVTGGDGVLTLTLGAQESENGGTLQATHLVIRSKTTADVSGTTTDVTDGQRDVAVVASTEANGLSHVPTLTSSVSVAGQTTAAREAGVQAAVERAQADVMTVLSGDTGKTGRAQSAAQSAAAQAIAEALGVPTEQVKAVFDAKTGQLTYTAQSTTRTVSPDKQLAALRAAQAAGQQVLTQERAIAQSEQALAGANTPVLQAAQQAAAQAVVEALNAPGGSTKYQARDVVVSINPTSGAVQIVPAAGASWPALELPVVQAAVQRAVLRAGQVKAAQTAALEAARNAYLADAAAHGIVYTAADLKAVIGHDGMPHVSALTPKTPSSDPVVIAQAKAQLQAQQVAAEQARAQAQQAAQQAAKAAQQAAAQLIVQATPDQLAALKSAAVQSLHAAATQKNLQYASIDVSFDAQGNMTPYLVAGSWIDVPQTKPGSEPLKLPTLSPDDVLAAQQAAAQVVTDARHRAADRAAAQAQAERVKAVQSAKDAAAAAAVAGEASVSTTPRAPTAIASVQGPVQVGTASLTNRGQLKATQDLRVDVTALNNQGIVSAGTMADVVADAVHNEAGGQITAQGKLTAHANNVVNAGMIGAGEVALTIGRGLLNRGTIDAQGKLGAHATHLVNGVTGATDVTRTQLRGAQVDLVADQHFSNRGAIMGADALSIATANLANAHTGVIYGGNATTINLTQAAYQNQGVIASDGQASLYVPGALDLNGTALAPTTGEDGLLTLKAAGDITVEHGVQSAGDVLLQSGGSINNRSHVVAGGRLGALAQHIGNEADGLMWAGQQVDLIGVQSIRNEHNAQIIAAGGGDGTDGDINLQSLSVTNNLGTVQAARDLNVDAVKLTNAAQLTGSVTSGGQETSQGGTSIGEGYTLFGPSRYDTYRLSIGIDSLDSDLDVNQGVLQAGRDVNLNQGKDVQGRALYGAASATNHGQVLAGGDVNVTGDLNNVGLTQTVSLADYLKRPAAISLTVTDSAASLSSTSRQFGSLYQLLDFAFGSGEQWYEIWGLYKYNTPGLAKALANLSAQPQLAQVLNQVLGSDWKAQVQDHYGTLVTRWNTLKAAHLAGADFTFAPAHAALIQANGDIHQVDGRVINGTGAEQHAQTPVTATIGQYEVATFKGDFAVKTNLALLSPRLDTLGEAAKLLAVKGLFKEAAPIVVPAGEPPRFAIQPLYETNLAYLDQRQFKGSDYFFKQVGYAPLKTVAVLGDNYFTTEQIARQIRTAIGNFYATPEVALVTALMNHAGQAAAKLGLVVGEEPSAEQLAKLDDDIIWYVTALVDGKPVLVPNVYFSAATLHAVLAGRAREGVAALAAHGKVDIVADATGVANVNGLIQGSAGTSVQSDGAVTNVAYGGVQGGITSDQTVQVDAKGDVTNQGATLSGHDVSLKTQGKFIDTASFGYDGKGQATLASQGRVHADGNHGTLGIQANRGIALSAAQVSGHAIELDAGQRSLVSNTVNVVDSSYATQTEHGVLYSTHSETTHGQSNAVGTTIDARTQGSLSIAGEGIRLEGGTYQGARAMIDARGGDLVIGTSKDYAYDKTTQSSVGFTAGASIGVGLASARASFGTAPGQTEAVAQAHGGENADGSLGNTQFGLQLNSSTDTAHARTNRNAQLDASEALTLKSQKSVDIGGADLRTDMASGTLDIDGARVASTKYQDERAETHEDNSLFIGIKGEQHSAFKKVVDDVAEQVQKQTGGQTKDAGTAALQAGTYVGDALNIAFGDSYGASVKLAAEGQHTSRASRSTVDNLTQVSGNRINLTSRTGDLNLAGVKVEGAAVSLDVAGSVNLAAAKATSQSSSETYNAGYSIGGSFSSNAVFRSAGVGINEGVNVGHHEQVTADVKYTNAELNAGQVLIRSGGDLTLRGANVKGETVALQVGGNTHVMSLQDQHHADTLTWGATVSRGAGAGVNHTVDPVLGVVANPTFTIGANGSRGWEERRTTVRQAGIEATQQLTGEVKGDVNLTGGYLVSRSGAGSVKVGGQVRAIDVVDQQHKDGNSGGGTLALKPDGMATLEFSYGKDDQVHRTEVQRGTLAVKDLQVGGGIVGPLNREAAQGSSVTDDRKIAGSKLTVEVGDLLEHIKGRLQSKSKSVAGKAPPDDEPDGRWSRPARQSAVADAGKPVPAEQSGTSSAKHGPDRYAQRVIVQQGDDPVTAQAAQHLANKHLDNTTVVKAGPDGKLEGLDQIAATRGNVKVQVVGHGGAESGRLGGVDAPELAKQIGQVKARLGDDAAVDKVALVGCKTACLTEGGQPSLTTQVETELAKQGTVVGEVKGRTDYVKVDLNGRKLETGSGPDALGKIQKSVNGINISIDNDSSPNGATKIVVPEGSYNFASLKEMQEQGVKEGVNIPSDIFDKVKADSGVVEFALKKEVPESCINCTEYLMSVFAGDNTPFDYQAERHGEANRDIILSATFKNFKIENLSDVDIIGEILPLRSKKSIDDEILPSIGQGLLLAETRAHNNGAYPFHFGASIATVVDSKGRVAASIVTDVAEKPREEDANGSSSSELPRTKNVFATIIEKNSDFRLDENGRVGYRRNEYAIGIVGAERREKNKRLNFEDYGSPKRIKEAAKEGAEAMETTAFTAAEAVVLRPTTSSQATSSSESTGRIGDARTLAREETIETITSAVEDRALPQAASLQTSSSERVGLKATESDKPPVRDAWVEPTSVAARSQELDRAFSTPLPKGPPGQQAALEQLRLVSNYLKARSSPDAGESQDLLQKLTNPELVVRMRTLASTWEGGKDNVRKAAVLGHAQLVSALLKESACSPEQARDVFNTLTMSQENPSYLNTLATVATKDKSVARALDGILKNLHQQMGADEVAAKEIRTKLLDRPIRSESQYDKYDEEFYGRLFDDGSTKWMEDHAGSRLLARDMKRSDLIPTPQEIVGAGLSDRRAKKYLGAVKKALISGPEVRPALPETVEAAGQLASALTPKALQRREQATIELAHDSFVKTEIEKAEGQLSWMVFQIVQQEWQKAMTQAGLSDREQIQPLKLSQSISAELASEPSIKNYLALVEANARASAKRPSEWAPEAAPGNAVGSAIHEIVPVRVEGAVRDTMVRAAQDAAKEKAREEARAKVEEEAREAAEAKATEEARKEAKVRAEEEARQRAADKAKEEAGKIARERAEESTKRETEARARAFVEREAMKRLDRLSETIQKLNREDERRSVEELEARYIALRMPSIDRLPSLRLSERASERQASREAEYIDSTGRVRRARQ